MRVLIVGQLDGKRRVRWGAALLVACLLGAFGALGAGVTYYALSGAVSPPALMLGFGGGFIALGTGVVRALQLPVEQLTPLGRVG
jgi:hypothetical protein